MSKSHSLTFKSGVMPVVLPCLLFPTLPPHATGAARWWPAVMSVGGSEGTPPAVNGTTQHQRTTHHTNPAQRLAESAGLAVEITSKNRQRPQPTPAPPVSTKLSRLLAFSISIPQLPQTGWARNISGGGAGGRWGAFLGFLAINPLRPENGWRNQHRLTGSEEILGAASSTHVWPTTPAPSLLPRIR